MCHPSVIDFGKAKLTPDEVRGASVLEVGSYNVNGTLRQTLEAMGPASYHGVDISMGPGVDEVCGVDQLVERFGRDKFDLVVSTEMFEHVRDWRDATTNLKNVLKPGGTLLLTTRSRGFPYHGYPFDFWRYEPADMEVIFGDMEILANEPDPEQAGVFIKARRPDNFVERDLTNVHLYSIVTRRRQQDVSDGNLAAFKAKMAVPRFISKAIVKPARRTINRLLG